RHESDECQQDHQETFHSDSYRRDVSGGEGALRISLAQHAGRPSGATQIESAPSAGNRSTGKCVGEWENTGAKKPKKSARHEKARVTLWPQEATRARVPGRASRQPDAITGHGTRQYFRSWLPMDSPGTLPDFSRSSGPTISSFGIEFRFKLRFESRLESRLESRIEFGKPWLGFARWRPVDYGRSQSVRPNSKGETSEIASDREHRKMPMRPP